MRGFIPERFAVIRTFREDRYSKTFLANDHLSGRENVIVRIIRKENIEADRDQLIEHFSWAIGVQHSLFATVLDAGLTKRQDLYFVREFVPPSELFSADVSSWIPFLISAIDFLHRHDRIHGAIKPSNIFATNEIFKIADTRPDGLRLVEGEDSIHFTAPEILRGAPVSHEGDLYSIGAVLYRALTGRHLFEDSDLNRLRSKYLSAAPQPTPPLSVVLHSIAQLTLDLLGKNPADRREAFERLKCVVPLRPFGPQRCALIGRERELQQVIELVEKPTSLRVISLEGEIGIGKTRLIDEIQLHCTFRGYTFAIWQCKQNSADLAPIAEGLHRLIRTAAPPADRFTLERSKPQKTTTTSDAVEHPPEKTMSDMISLLASFAIECPTVVVVEDVNLADAATVMFLEQLAFRASDLPLTLLVAMRPVEVEPKWVTTVVRCLGTDFHSFRLLSLSEEQSRALAKFVETDSDREAMVLKLAAGNPLFISAFASSKQSLGLTPSSVAEAADTFLSLLNKNTRRLLEVLSVIQRPLCIDVLQSLCDTTIANLEGGLANASRLGIVRCDGGTVEIKFPIIRDRLFKSLPKKTKVRISRRAYTLLRDVECDLSVLAEYAFQAGLFHDAALLFADLADCEYKSEDYSRALTHYERLRQCRKYLHVGLTATESVNAARCYDRTGRQRSSSRLYKELLHIESVQGNPSLLSLVYTRLAMAANQSAWRDRLRYLELAIGCLPKDSSLIPRYKSVCDILAASGDLSGAKKLFAKMEEYVLRDNGDPTALDECRAGILLSTCDFRGSIKCYRRCLQHAPKRVPLLVNIGFCFEHLGELETALNYYFHAHEGAAAAGDNHVHLLSINNLAAIKTKLGQMHEAARLFGQSLDELRNLNTHNKIQKELSFVTVGADMAINATHRGDYAMAHRCLKDVHVSHSSMAQIDMMLCQTIRCKFLTEIGLTNRARRIVQQWFDFDDLTNGFAQTERALLEARFTEIPAAARLDSLHLALKNSHELGTSYHQCEILISLASVYLELDKKQNARDYLMQALELANKNSYRLLAARAMMLSGIACEEFAKKQQYFSEAFQQASEMGLQEIVAESAYHIGVLNLESGNTITAREYLIRSTSITAKLADGVPANARSKYLAKQWRRDALRALERCNAAIPVDAVSMFNSDADKHFAAVYRFTMAASAATSVESLLGAIEKTLTESLLRSAVITIGSANESRSIPIKLKISPELSERIQVIRAQARNRVYFDSLDEKGKQPIGWIPMKSETYDGGIYLAYRPHESPFTEKEIELLTMIGTIASSALKRLEMRQAQEEEPRDIFEFHGILGASKPIKEVYSQIQMAAGNAATVLLEGESGTGKELVARAIHAAGPRAKQAFIAIDCGAIPEGLIEAELFGAKRGSYTGAVADRSGLFEAAHRGTLFLDEISNTTPALQAKLLRVIQERAVRRLGETKDRAIDVRVIVASNRSLAALADVGQFRKDLLYRLRVLHIQMPPLRDRRDDIPMLAHAFLQRLNTANKTRKCFGAGLVDHLCTYTFPGNVRELQNVIERAFFLTKGIVITEIPLESPIAAGDVLTDEIQTWFHDIKEGRKDFWSVIHNRYKRRDISREKVLAFVDFGLRSTRGSYTTMASMFRLKENDYRRFMDFLRRNDCLLDFRPYRKAATAS